MFSRRHFLALCAVALLPARPARPAPPVRGDLVLVNGWLCKPSDLAR
jgi:hypothetical protein